MKLLFDANLSDKIIPLIIDLFPGSTHVKAVKLEQANDRRIWDWAKDQKFTLISKDTDFYQMSFLYGPPPKFIWLRIGNQSTDLIVKLLRLRHPLISTFIQNQTESLLVLSEREFITHGHRFQN